MCPAQVLEQTVGNLAQRFDMSWRISYRERRKRVAIFVSKLDHCLFDILIRHQSGAEVVPWHRHQLVTLTHAGACQGC